MSLLFNGMGFEPENDRLKVICIGSDQIHLPGATTFAITILSITAFSIKVSSTTQRERTISSTELKGIISYTQQK
jgi:hypothetical protein